MMRKFSFTAIFCMLLFPVATLQAGGGAEKAPAVTMALSGSPDTLDPQKTSATLAFQALKSVYDTLVEPDASGAIVPALAESWRTSDDGTAWTFTLRQGVAFHNGDPLTSADVKATFDRIRNPATASPKAGEYSTIESIETPDEKTVVFRFGKPYAPFLATLASGWSAILPSKLIASGHDFGSKPVGTGPFELVSWVRDNAITLKRNESYWMKGFPKIESVVLQTVPEQAVQLQGLLTGRIHIVEGFAPEMLSALKDNPDVTIERELTSLVMVLAMNVSRPGLDSLELRQAVNHAIDKQKILDIAYGGGKIGGTFMDASDPYYVDFSAMYPYDEARARSMIAALKPEQRRTFEMTVPQNYPAHVKAAELYQEMLSKVGLDVKIRLVDESTWLGETYRNAKYDFTVIGHTGKLDPDGRLSGYGTEKAYVRWIDPEAAKLIESARSVTEFKPRQALYARVLEIMAREVPQVYTGTSYRYIAHGSKVTGFRMTAKLDTYDFRWCEVR